MSGIFEPRGIDAPYLELGFYFSQLTGDQAIDHVFRQLVLMGATCTGRMLVKSGSAVRARALPHIVDHSDIFSRTVGHDRDAEAILSDANIRVLEIRMANMPAFPVGTKLILTQLGIPNSCINGDNNPVAIWLDGSPLSNPTGDVPQKARRLCKFALDAFRRIIACVNPAYAAVTVDYELDCPCSLRANPDTYAFHDFYLSESFLGRNALDVVRRKAPNAYHERTQHGQLTCASKFIAPKNAFLTSEAGYELSSFCGKLIGARA